MKHLLLTLSLFVFGVAHAGGDLPFPLDEITTQGKLVSWRDPLNQYHLLTQEGRAMAHSVLLIRVESTDGDLLDQKVMVYDQSASTLDLDWSDRRASITWDPAAKTLSIDDGQARHLVREEWVYQSCDPSCLLVAPF